VALSKAMTVLFAAPLPDFDAARSPWARGNASEVARRHPISAPPTI